jgi:hypothetical protein
VTVRDSACVERPKSRGTTVARTNFIRNPDQYPGPVPQHQSPSVAVGATITVVFDKAVSGT